MGQSASTQRADFLSRDNRRFSQLVQERNERNENEGHGRQSNRHSRIFHRGSNQTNVTTSGRDSRRDNNVYGTFRRQVSAQSITVQTEAGRPEETVGTDEVVYEQEERPLVNMEDLGMRNAPITHIAATPISRRSSTMSRLGSRLLPDAVVRGLHNSGEETPAEGRAHRTGLQGRLSSSSQRVAPGHAIRRHSTIGSFLSRSPSSTLSSRPSIRGPFPANYAEPVLLPDPSHRSNYRASTALNEDNTVSSGSSRRRARFSRFRNSLSMPFSSRFVPPVEQSDPAQAPPTPPHRPSRVAFADDADHLLPPIANGDGRLDFDEPPHELDSIEPELRPTFSSSSTSPTPSTRALQAASGIRRLPNAIRARSTRMVRREERHSLSRVLQLAAAVIAAQLSGHTAPAVPNVQAVGADGLDGTLETFLQTLQTATSVQANGNGAEGDSALGQRDGNLPPVNFLRVFRFANSDIVGNSRGSGNANGPGNQEDDEDRMDIDEPTEAGSDGRTVTLVVVGVRSVPSGNGAEDIGNNLGQSLDALLSLPIVPATNVMRNHGSGGLLRRADGRSRFSTRRNSMGNLTTFPANYDSQRHQRTNGSRSQSEAVPPMNGSTLPTVLSESPPGPHPPPSTPAEPGLSAYSSGTTTPNRRPSSASALHPPSLPNLHENPVPRTSVEPSTDESTFNTARQRRRSDSEFARHRELGSGAARRNGVVEPDNAPAQGGRSWLIYVVGTNLSENHPAFATPSLFTDNPTYEDMLLLSSLLGPAKPPVATQADVTSAGGIYRLIEYGGSLIAEALGNAESIPILIGERCLICLCDYEVAEEVRQLTKCQHMYHRECIDEWLTTGRNSCPLCRGQGVDDSSSSRQAT